MNKISPERAWKAGARVMAAATTVMLASMTVLPSIAHAATTDTVYTDDTNILMDNGALLTIIAGSTAESVAVSATTVTIVAPATGFILRAAASATSLPNTGGSTYGICTQTTGTSQILTVVGDVGATIVVTPSPTGCGSGGGGGGGGGGYSAPAAPSCAVVSPNGGETLNAGEAKNISWTSTSSDVTNSIVQYSVDGGAVWGNIASGLSTSSSYANTLAWTVPNTATANGKIRVVCNDASGSTLASDTSDSTFNISGSATSPVAPAPEAAPAAGVMSRAAANAMLPALAEVDSLVRLASNSAVYYIGLDGKRHPFPNTQVFNSWYPDFSKVKVISDSIMASITLGKPILARPGSRWVKIQSDPKTYYVAPDGYTLRWVKDEATALLLGGALWNKNIIDIEPTYFTKFKMGADITFDSLATTWPKGALVQKPGDATVWYITGTSRRAFASSTALKANGFQPSFVLSSSAAGWQLLPVGEQIVGLEDGLFSLQNL